MNTKGKNACEGKKKKRKFKKQNPVLQNKHIKQCLDKIILQEINVRNQQ